MKIKFIILFVRLLKMLKMFDKFVPVLNNMPRRCVSNKGLYQHYGRIVLAKPNPKNVQIRFSDAAGNHISEMEYEKQFNDDKHPYIENAEGMACNMCDFERLGLPCRCDFKQGFYRGYYKVIFTSKQNATSTLKPSKILIKP